MIKKIIPPLLLLLTIPLGELYRIWQSPKTNNRQWFLFSDLAQDLEWYIKDTSEGLIWVIFLSVWVKRETGRSKFWTWLVALFLVYRITDLCAYWINHRHAGLVYFFCYLSIIFYAAGYFVNDKFKRK